METQPSVEVSFASNRLISWILYIGDATASQATMAKALEGDAPCLKQRRCPSPRFEQKADRPYHHARSAHLYNDGARHDGHLGPLAKDLHEESGSRLAGFVNARIFDKRCVTLKVYNRRPKTRGSDWKALTTRSQNRSGHGGPSTWRRSMGLFPSSCTAGFTST